MKDRTASYVYKIKDGVMASGLLEYLTLGGRDTEIIGKLSDKELKTVILREDCADFKVAYLVRVLYSFENLLKKDVFDGIVNELLSFPYEDCGGHGMCTWTENHRLYIAGSELLLAKKFPDQLFGDGRASEYHYSHAKAFLLRWLDKSIKYGMCEWCSNNYYSETMAGLSNVIQFADDKEIVNKAKKVLLSVITDIFSQTAVNDGYMYNPACARAYADNKISSLLGNYEEVDIRAFLGEKIDRFKDKEGCVINLLNAKNENGKPVFEIPNELISLIKDKGEREISLVQGINIADYKREGISGYSRENVEYALEAGAFSDYRVINNTMRYLKETGLIDNAMLYGITPFSNPLLVKTGLLKLVKRFLTVEYDGVAMEEGRVYTYVNRNYSMSAAFDYKVGEPSYQQNSFSVNLSHRISLFANSPSKGPGAKGSPGYWIGNKVTPRAVLYKNVGACIFDNSGKKSKGTHLFFPTGLFDITDLSHLHDGILLGHTNGVNVCVRTNKGVAFVPAKESLSNDLALYQDCKVPKGYYSKEYDLINSAKGYHFYLFEVDNSMEFNDFTEAMLKRNCLFDEKTSSINYNEGFINCSYKGPFVVNGKEFVPDFVRPVELMGKYIK